MVVIFATRVIVDALFDDYFASREVVTIGQLP